MAVSLTANMSARSITVTVSGLSEEHTGGRTFTWAMDDGAPVSEKVYSAVSSYSHTFQKVRYAANHTITVRISDIKDAELYYSGSVQVADSLAFWSWAASNGDASDEQVKAAYKALTENSGSGLKGLTTDFSRMVWNDLADSTSSALAASGLSWDAAYSTLAGAKMTAADDALTAVKFNSISRNLRYPWMYWSCKPERTGYTGRLDFSAGDAVYGSYLLEIAHILNVMVDAIGDKGAGYATLMAVMDALRITTSERLRMRSPQAVRCASPDAFLRQHGSVEMLAFLCRQNFVSDVLPSVSGCQSMVSPRARRSFLTDVLPSVSGDQSVLGAPESRKAVISNVVPLLFIEDTRLTPLAPARIEISDAPRLSVAEEIILGTSNYSSLGTMTEHLARVRESLIMEAEKVKRYLEHSAGLGYDDVTLVAATSRVLRLVSRLYADPTVFLSASPSGILLLDEHIGPYSTTTLWANLSTQLLASPHFGPRSDTRLYPRPSELLRAYPHFGPASNTELSPSPSSRLSAGHHLGPSPDAVIQPDESDHLVAGHHLGPSPNVLIRPDKAEHLDAVHHLCPSPDVKIRPDKSDHLTAGHHIGPSPDVIIQPGKSGNLGAKHQFGPAPDVLIQPGKSGHLKACHRLGPEPYVIIQPGKSGYLSVYRHFGPSSDAIIQPGKSGHLSTRHHLGPAPDVLIQPGKSGHLVAGHRLGPTPDVIIQPGKSGHLAALRRMGPASETELYPSPSEYLMMTLHDGPVSDSKLHPSPSKHFVATLHYVPVSDSELYPSPSEYLEALNHEGPVSDSELYPSPSEYLKAAVHTGPAPVTKLFPSPSEYLEASNHGGPRSDTRLFPSPSEYLSADNHIGPASETELYPSPSELLRANPHLGPASDTELHPSPSALLQAILHFGAESSALLTSDNAVHLSHFAAILSNMGAAMETEYRPGDTVTDDLRSVAAAILHWAASVHTQHTATGRSSGTVSLTTSASLPILDRAVVSRIVSGSLLPMIPLSVRKPLHEAVLRFTRQQLAGESPGAAKGQHASRQNILRQDLSGESPGAAKGHHTARLHITVGTDPMLSTPSSSLTVAAGLRDVLYARTNGLADLTPASSVYAQCADTALSGLAQTCTMDTFRPIVQTAAGRSLSSGIACLDTVAPSKCGVVEDVKTAAGAVLETERVGTEWVYPVERGTDLLIQQAAVLTDRGTDLLIE